MAPLAILLGLPIAISLTLSIMLAIAWLGFGRPRHAATWSAAHALVAVHMAANGALVAVAGLGIVLRPAIGFAVVGAGALKLIGARQRGGDRRWRDVAAIVAASTGAAIAMEAAAAPALALALPGLVAAGFSIAAAHGLPSRVRRTLPSERAFAATLLLLAAAELATALAAASLVGWPDWSFGRTAYVAGFAVAIPLGAIVSGIAAVLLIASDLADDLRRLAAFDPLTGVHNRRGFDDAAARAIAVAQRRGAALSVALVDADHFKAINDGYGHSTGDAALVAIAQHLAAGIREGDLVARIGGEEFALLLVDLDAADTLAAVDRIRATLRDGVRAAGVAVDVTASFGVARVALGASAADDLLAAALARADRALYAAKAAGRDRTAFAD